MLGEHQSDDESSGNERRAWYQDDKGEPITNVSTCSSDPPRVSSY